MRKGFASSSSTEALKKTSFYDLHLSIGGKMVPFAGYELPVQYENLGVLKEHLHVRAPASAGLFDVSHMGQIKWYGKDAIKFLESVVVGDLQSLKPGEAKLSLIMNEKGGIVDDTVITNAGDHIFMVVNGACKYKDIAHFQKYLNSSYDVHFEHLEDQQLLALQGKGAKLILEKLAPSINLSKMGFMSSIVTTVAGIPNCRVSRCGYTGEDGFEISVDPKQAVNLAQSLLSHDTVKPAGLGARDSLRLEAGLCLYGNDLDEDVDPASAALIWTIGGPKSRRRLEQGFLGAEKFLEKDGKVKATPTKRVGIAGMKAPARHGTEIYTVDGQRKLGVLTSGGFGPSCQKAVAMGYIASEHSKDGSEIAVMIRGKLHPAQVTKMPFHPTDYYRAV
jgi:aminomethyltransferase